MSAPLQPYSVIDADGRLLYFGLALDLPELDKGQTLINERPPSSNHYRDGDQWVELPPRPFRHYEFDYTSKEWVDARPLDEVRDLQLKAIDVDFEVAAQALTAGYPLTEQMTWPTQQAEALAWSKDPAAPTPYLDGIAAVRGIAPDEMRTRTLENLKAFLAGSQLLVGQRQRLRDEVLLAQTHEEVKNICWSVDIGSGSREGES